LIGSLLSRGSAKRKISQWFEKVELPGGTGKALFWLLKLDSEEEPAKIAEMAPAELQEVISEAYMAEGDTEKETDREVEEIAVQLLREIVRNKKKAIMEDMEQARKDQDEEKEGKLFEELNELNKKESKIIALLG
jgi:hypothetical protein